MKRIALTILIFAFPIILSAQKPIAVHPDNPHYFIWKAEPVVLVTSAEHYGSIINLDFDFEKYLETVFKNITVFNHHYDRDALSLELNYHLDRILTFNETGLMPISTEEYRIQSWRYMLSGGALYNNLDFTYQVGAEDGSGTTEFNCVYYNGCTDPDIKHQMKVLLDFMNSIDFVNMKPSPESLAVYFGDQDICCLANPGMQYAIYIAGGKPGNIMLNIENGEYLLNWIRPVDGKVIQSDFIEVTNRSIRVDKPEYETDLALRIVIKD